MLKIMFNKKIKKCVFVWSFSGLNQFDFLKNVVFIGHFINYKMKSENLIGHSKKNVRDTKIVLNVNVLDS
jgi:hypothetical protein